VIDIDSFLDRRFDISRYNCWHFLREVWLELTGEDLGDRTPERLSQNALVARFDSDVPAFKKLPGPADPSLALMTRRGSIPHVGVYIKGRILQLAKDGPTYLPPRLAAMGFDEIGYYR
jgi:hypothetical protein